MRVTIARLGMFYLSLSLFPACIQEAEPRYDEDDDSITCAPAPSGAGVWEDESEDGLHCNYQDNTSGEWAYGLNSSESSCVERGWAPYQNDGGSMKPWYWEGDRGCDWVIPW